MGMTSVLAVGSVVGAGFIVASTERREGKMRVVCPECRYSVWRHQSNLLRSKSRGRDHAAGIRRAKRLESFRVIVDAARVVFATDPAYGIQMAQVANRIHERRSDVDATV